MKTLDFFKRRLNAVLIFLTNTIFLLIFLLLSTAFSDFAKTNLNSSESFSQNSFNFSAKLPQNSFNFSQANAFALAQFSQYGLILENTVLLNASLSPVTTLPPTFFVTITDENTLFDHYKVTYNGLSGLVQKSQIQRIDFEPVTTEHTALFTAANDTHPVLVRSAPFANALTTASIPHGGTAFLFGEITGEALISSVGGRWFFVRFGTGSGAVFGYVYSAQGIADPIPVNIIERKPDVGGGGDGGDGDGETDNLTPNPRFDWIYILLLTIPAVVVVLAIFSRPKQKEPKVFD
ncbi:MAG: hypothetical protein FWD86_00740 [Firmicutes bacterium]|nr:hypothetical protein [Bacillota bacterium]